ncbi:MAG: hypothetical protein J6I49_00850 [Bacteroidales bacterium]|nr:hypothetical protein [Bacteroidales bacterium]
MISKQLWKQRDFQPVANVVNKQSANLQPSAVLSTPRAPTGSKTEKNSAPKGKNSYIKKRPEKPFSKFMAKNQRFTRKGVRERAQSVPDSLHIFRETNKFIFSKLYTEKERPLQAETTHTRCA